jgi:hypothetical protein
MSHMARGAKIRVVTYKAYLRVFLLRGRDKVSSLNPKGPSRSTTFTTSNITVFFKSNNHVMENDATHHPVGMVLKLVIILQWVSKLPKRLEAAFKSSKCMFHPNTNLIN